MNHALNHAGKRITASVILLSLCFCSAGLRLSRANQSDEIVLPEGAALNVVTAQEINSKDAKPNDPVSFTVSEDLTINGQVIVRKGTAAVGSVINAEKGGNLAKFFLFDLASVRAIDSRP